MSGPDAEIRAGNAPPLRNIPVGTVVHAIELKPGAGAKMAARRRQRPADGQGGPHGHAAAALRRDAAGPGDLPRHGRAVGNAEHELIQLGKAGRARWKGKRPSVRGVAMNSGRPPVGRRRGQVSGGCHPASPWGQKEGRTRRRRRRRASTSFVAAGRAWLMPRSLKKGPFADDHLMKKVADMNKAGEKKVVRDVVAPLDDHPGHARSHDRGARRPQARAGVRLGGDGRAQARRVRSDAHVRSHARDERRNR
jgi:hypothetical protein